MKCVYQYFFFETLAQYFGFEFTVACQNCFLCAFFIAELITYLL